MNKLQIELSQLICYEIGKLGQDFNTAVMYDTIRILEQGFTTKELRLMITGEHSIICDIHQAITNILTDTYHESIK